jgi:transposase
VSPFTALTYVLISGTPRRFSRGNQVGTYVGIIPSEESSGDKKQRLGHISKQGNPYCASCCIQCYARCEAVDDQPWHRILRLQSLETMM